MKMKNFGYSLKNIAIPTKRKYLKCMVEKVQSFIRRLKWKAYHFCKDDKQIEDVPVKNFGFKSLTTPPQNEYLNPFENNLYKLIGKVEFMNTKNEFQKQLAEDVENIQSSKVMFVFADKSTNLQQMSSEKYRNLIHQKLTKKLLLTLKKILTRNQNVLQNL